MPTYWLIIPPQILWLHFSYLCSSLAVLQQRCCAADLLAVLARQSKSFFTDICYDRNGELNVLWHSLSPWEIQVEGHMFGHPAVSVHRKPHILPFHTCLWRESVSIPASMNTAYEPCGERWEEEQQACRDLIFMLPCLQATCELHSNFSHIKLAQKSPITGV